MLPFMAWDHEGLREPVDGQHREGGREIAEEAIFAFTEEFEEEDRNRHADRGQTPEQELVHRR